MQEFLNFARRMGGGDEQPGAWPAASAGVAEIQAVMKADYERKLDDWARRRPIREHALAVWQAAYDRRCAEVDIAPRSMPIVATALWAEPPARPTFLR